MTSTTSLFKTVKFCKILFTKNITQDGGAMKHVINDIQDLANKDDFVIIHSFTQKHGRMWSAVLPTTLLNVIEKDNGIYEVITKYPHKVYFDIDKETNDTINATEFLQSIKNTITQYFPNADMAISGSVNKKKGTIYKTSYHIALDNYTIHTPEERNYVKCLCKYLKENVDDGFDTRVYNDNQNMKCINQTKANDTRVQEIIENADWKKHIITAFISNISLPFMPLPLLIETEVHLSNSKKRMDMGELPKFILHTEDDVDIEHLSPLELLKYIPINSSFTHSYTHLIARFCHYNDIPFDTFMGWLKNKHTVISNDIYTKWMFHFTQISRFPQPCITTIHKLIFKYYPKLYQECSYRRFLNAFQLPKEHIQYIDRIGSIHFKHNEKYLVFNTGMGSGKTEQTKNFLKTQDEFIWIAPNIALSNNTETRLQSAHIEVANYQKFQNKKDREAKNIQKQKKLLICANSLHYMEQIKYDCVIIDEIETLLDRFLGDFMAEKKAENFDVLCNLLRQAKRVVFLDAFITTKTLKFIEVLEGGLWEQSTTLFNQSIKTAKMKIFQRKDEPATRTVKMVKKWEFMMADAIQKIKDGFKPFIFYPYKSGGSKFPSMEKIQRMMEENTGKRGVCYNAMVDDTIKKELCDVNENWKDYDFVITNNVITCGVNYDLDTFDYTYLFIANHNSMRDIIQVSYRCRSLSTGIIYVSYMGKMMQTNTWEVDYIQGGLMNECKNKDIYISLFNDILIEKKAPLRKAFEFFCKKASYTLKTSVLENEEELKKYTIELLSDEDLKYSYTNISTVDEDRVREISLRLKEYTASTDDKMEIAKYYFTSNYMDKDALIEGVGNNCECGMLSYIWDTKLLKFCDKIHQLSYIPNNIFEQIKEYNKLPSIFPENVKKTKLSTDIIQEIFKHFKFKFLKPSSSSNLLIAEIYNVYFGTTLIKSSYDENRNVLYSIDNNVNIQIYDYVIGNRLTQQKIDEVCYDMETNSIISNEPRYIEDLNDWAITDPDWIGKVL